MTTIRRVGASSVATLFGVAAVVLLTSLIAPKWTQAAGLDVWELPALRNEIETTVKSNRAMTAELEENKMRLAFKQELIDGLLTQRASLKEVTNQFLLINQSQSASICAIRATYKGATDEEKTARNVISFAVLKSQGSFTQQMEVMARLTLELRELTGDPSAETR